ncbi:helix-turn-helix transcriptional regulator [Nocardia sp. PE-7]|uniref:helix-turn-helix domain-containing protein n=1 Tax=Nocardia sp. PE-7 TaxID=3058426 RepID=UPI00265A1037|nr:helix-turn-helix transcriptional regulator [Nocardia sp. PE-7]WKG12694.1 helix-turn-helix transcriptional regulator [Nocardia sp. PE-7]
MLFQARREGVRKLEDQAPIGLRIKRHRERAGISRPVLGDRINRSSDWVKQIENGVLQPPKLPMVLAIADALGLADLAELTGNGHAVSVNLYAGARHKSLGDVQAALTDFRRPLPGRAHNVAHLAERLRLAWEVRHASPDHRTQLGAILPSLIRDCPGGCARTRLRPTAGASSPGWCLPIGGLFRGLSARQFVGMDGR